MSKNLKNMKKVLEVDDSFMDEDEVTGRPRYFVTLKRGWAFEDPAEKPSDDPEGRRASHCRGGTVLELQRHIRNARPCKCGRCVGGRQ